MKSVLSALVLRGGSAAAKFLFVLYLARKADSSLLGQLAVMMAIATIFTQVAGLEINQVLARQVHGLTPDERACLLRRHAFASISAYLLLTPVILFAYSDLLAGHWISVVAILTLEHFVTEVFRLNIVLLRPVYASALLFAKNAGWVLSFVLLVEAGWAAPSLHLAVQCWAGVLALTAVPLLFTRQALPTLHEYVRPMSWMRPTGTLVWQARSFIVSAVAVAGIGAMDKLLISEKYSSSELGVYFFFATCASVMTLIVTFSVGSTAGPRCIKIYTTEGRGAYLPQYRRLKRLYFLIAAVTTLALTLPADWLLGLLGKPDYQQHIAILYLLVPSAALVVLCEPYKINAYLERRDLGLVLGNLFHLAALVACIWLCMLNGDIVHVSAGVLASSLLAFLFFSLDLGDRLIALVRPRA